MTHIIYLPGFGDWYDPLRKLALKRWNSDGTHATFVPMHWSDRRETYEQKYQRIADAIKAANSEKIVLIGESAGGAMALFAFSHHQSEINQVITICGYNHGAASVHQYHKYRHPAFYQLMPLVDQAVESFTAKAKSRITTIYSTKDRIVTPDHSQIKGTREVVLRTPGHLSNIGRILVKKLPYRFI